MFAFVIGIDKFTEKLNFYETKKNQDEKCPQKYKNLFMGRKIEEKIFFNVKFVKWFNKLC